MDAKIDAATRTTIRTLKTDPYRYREYDEIKNHLADEGWHPIGSGSYRFAWRRDELVLKVEVPYGGRLPSNEVEGILWPRLEALGLGQHFAPVLASVKNVLCMPFCRFQGDMENATRASISRKLSDVGIEMVDIYRGSKNATGTIIYDYGQFNWQPPRLNDALTAVGREDLHVPLGLDPWSDETVFPAWRKNQFERFQV